MKNKPKRSFCSILKEKKVLIVGMLLIFLIPIIYFSQVHQVKPIEDKKFDCRQRERYLLPVYIQEQLGKQVKHVSSVVWLAAALNRTLVLPHVGGNRIGMNYSFPFDFYYDTSSIQRYARTIGFDEFKENHDLDKLETSILLIEVLNKNVEHRCRGNVAAAGLSKSYPITWYIAGATDEERLLYTTNSICEELLLLCYYSPLPVANTLKYNISLPWGRVHAQMAENLVKQLGKYISIHWRFEELSNISNLPSCAKKVISRVKQLQKEQKFDSVFFATDLPITSEQSSVTFPNYRITSEMIATVSEVFDELKPKVFVPVEDLEIGLKAITDNILLSHSQYFFASGATCGKPRSSYAGIVVRDREVLKNEGYDIRNLVEYFDK